MANELGHMSAEIGLDIQPFLTNQAVLRTQIRRTGQLLKTMEDASKLTGSGQGNIFRTQIAQLRMYGQQIKNFRDQYMKAQQDLAKNNTVDNQRGLASSATQLQTAALKYDNLRMAAARTYQQMRAQNSWWGQQAQKIGDYGDKLQSVASRIRGIGSGLASAAIGGAFLNATKSAMAFKSQIQAIGPLLSEDGRVTASVTRVLNQMSSDSLKWSQQYGISTSQINNAMTELVRRGFTAQQTLGSMPAILNASRASGESLTTVMQATASAIEMFGLKANTTAGQIKNTNRVTDVLTVAANKTASSFADIAAAMTYVGPTASQAGMSIEQVAAAIGALSNRGIEASTAGTTLRQVLTRLTSDTKANRANMKAIGVDIDEIKKKGIDLPKLIDQINNKLKDKTPTEKMALLNAAFGKLGQGVMALFTKTNASSKSAGAELRSLENELYKAGGTTARIAKQMNNTPQAKWDRFKQTIHAVGVTVGSELLPMFTRAMNIVKGLAKRFDELSPAAKKAVTNFLLLVAALKPLSSLVAAPIAGLGKLMSAMKSVMNVGARISGGSLASAFRAVDAAAGNTGGITKYTSVLKTITPSSRSAAQGTASFGSKLLDTGSKALSAGSSALTVGSAFSGVGSAAAEGAAGMSGFGAALASTAEGIAIAAAAAASLYIAFEGWKNYVQPAINSFREFNHETSLWGRTVGKYPSEAGEKFMNFSEKATAAMNAAQSGVSGSSNSIKSAFRGMASAAESSSRRTNSALKSLSKDLGGSAGKIINQAREATNRNSRQQISAIQKDAAYAERIITYASKHNQRMSADTRQELDNLQSDMAAHFVRTLNVTRSASARMASVINGTFNKHLNFSQFKSLQNSLSDALGKSLQQTSSKLKRLSNAYHDGLISFRTYARAKSAIETEDGARTQKIMEGMIRLERQQGMSWRDVRANMQSYAQEYGMSASQMERAIDAVKNAHTRLQGVVAKTSGNISRSARAAGNAWNKLILNPKTGKVKTNVKQVLTDVAKTDSGWKKLQFITKHAKISSNAKDLITDAAVASGRWQSMSFSQKEALIHSNVAHEMAVYLWGNNQWNNLDWRVQKAIVKAKGKKELLDVFTNLKNWNLLKPEQKNLIISFYHGTDRLKLELQNIKQWNNLPMKEKKAIFKAAGTGQMEAALKKAHVWMALPASMRKEIRAIDKTGASVASAKRTVDSFTKTPAKKNVSVHLNTGNVVTDINNMSRSLNQLSQRKHTVTVDAHPGSGFDKTLQFNHMLQGMNGKHYTAHADMHVSGTSEVKNAANAQKTLHGLPNVRKNNQLHTSGSGEALTGAAAQKTLQGTHTVHRPNKLSASGTGQVNGATGAQRGLMSTRTTHRPNRLSATGTGQVNSAAGAQRGLMATHAVHLYNTIKTVVTKVFNTIHNFFTGKKHWWGTAGAWNFKRFAYGTPNTGFEGGEVVVGDGGRKEVVYEPRSRMLFTTPATDTLMNLEKDSIIWRSVEAFEQAMRFAGIKHYPKFADGTASASMVNVAAQLPDDVEDQIRTIANQSSRQETKAAKETRDLQEQNNELIAMLVQQNQQMMQFFSRIGFSFNVNGKEFAKATAQDNSKAISAYIKQSGMRFT